SLQKPQMGLKLQMRYSIPLFVYGQGIEVQREGTHHALVSTQQLRWQVVNHNGKPAIQVTNNDKIHVRLSEVTVQQGSSRRTLAQGLLGYVLPGSSRSWPLPSGMANPTQLSASVNARESVWRAPAQR
uniref:fimbrial biogenesis chaperone n=1 Tax=Atlantibacter sp. TaxID=1903473 RepID=UPI0039181A7E